jgi:hypothetical protein
MIVLSYKGSKRRMLSGYYENTCSKNPETPLILDFKLRIRCSSIRRDVHAKGEHEADGFSGSPLPGG